MLLFPKIWTIISFGFFFAVHKQRRVSSRIYVLNSAAENGNKGTNGTKSIPMRVSEQHLKNTWEQFGTTTHLRYLAGQNITTYPTTRIGITCYVVLCSHNKRATRLATPKILASVLHNANEMNSASYIDDITERVEFYTTQMKWILQAFLCKVFDVSIILCPMFP